ncbi:hypothetical protein [Arthrobacter cryoconiti]|uniref:Preprotein translocase subunit SecB n=1 Tax=Arthrobacter cryoconiti TaxID=748907 RepID=A0ABV8R3S1_9MICC|nr:hypothetical protein [Arthrobacter cryoconiti]MCC9066742.1 hypothetical protein [Arthrobacter cryoconiti]
MPDDQESLVNDGLNIHALLANVELVEMRVYLVAGERKDVPVDGATDQSADVDLKFMERHNPDILENRFRLKVENEEARYEAEIAAIYSLEKPMDPSSELIAEFAERVGFMAVFPYLRESISTSASRLGLPVPVLGIMRPGDFRISPPE